MNAADSAVELISRRIQQLRSEPDLVVRDLGELDAILFELHWLKANLIDRIDDFVAAMKVKHGDSRQFADLLGVIQSHEPVNSPNAAIVFESWDRFNAQFGE